ncbi:2-dehydropantoate 2-reductase/glutamate carboxypeptidase [Propionibacteriaceae bacterium ES.041]|uniref:ketopantoate reductase family protein n=1 Tax=Enemella evansiae TaxID=2016499 RepID=UPI000C00690F|nr:2-dehydropantoate 2-reductase [Enemella evansiae]PFG69338.1 2-dehydropantoate 2-reductase/glutamate carboxypeptidase [Propionibacteriaceae bacterium ES.041]
MTDYTILGGGAIGGTLGFHLARAGHRVRIVDADPDHVAAINTDGLRVDRDGTRAAVPVTATLPTDTQPAPADRVLLATKAQATPAAADWLAEHLAEEGFVVSVQNGLNEPLLAERLGDQRVVGCFVNIFADTIAPGVIRDGGTGALVVGEVDGRASTRVDEVVTDLQAWGPARATGNVNGFLWSKLGFGAMLVATALADAPMAELIDRHRPLMHALAAEIYAVATRLPGPDGAPLRLEAFDAYDPIPYLRGGSEADRATDTLVAWLRTQTKDRSGIWRDLAVRKRPTEVPSHYREVFRIAESLGVPTPLSRRLVDQIAELEAGGSMSTDRIDRLEESTR